MQSRWSDADAAWTIESHAAQGVAEDIALRVYTARLLGRDPRLVLHGGGNASVKTRIADLVGAKTEVLCVKGSGSDMGAIEPAGLPMVRLEPLRALRKLERLSDQDMVNALRGNLVDSAAPNPSVETLLHAFLPHKFVDHTHATAILGLVDQPNGEALAREVYDGRVGFVPYVMSGLALAKAAAGVFEKKPDVEGLILDKHGIFTFGEDARQAYERMIALVSLAEAWLKRDRRNVFAARPLPSALANPADIAPIVRGACAAPPGEADADPRRFVATFRTGAAILAYVNGADLEDYSRRGVATPDHIIRTKNKPLIAAAPAAGKLDAFAEELRRRVAAYVKDYDAYFARENKRVGGGKSKLDAMPRVVLVPGLGLFGLGESLKDAAIAADLAEDTLRVVTDAEAIGRYEPAGESDLFELEYWSLEQAKRVGSLGKALGGQVAMVTGGAGAIGLATARAFREEGADIVLLDLDRDAAAQAAAGLGGLGIACDVTDRASVSAAFDAVCERFGGVDILVSNAGAAWAGRIGEVPDEVLRESFEINFFAHQSVAQEAVRIMLAQGTGGCLLFNVSKQAVNPGANFGPYGLPKAATMLLVRQYAVDYGVDGIRSNGVNADRIRSGLLTDGFIAERAHARGVSEGDYMRGNLLRREVTAQDVAQAFVHLAKARKTTGHIAAVDGGNIAAALR